MKQFRFLSTLVTGALLATACSSNEPGPNGEGTKVIDMTPDEVAIATTTNSFSLDMYNATADKEENGNFMVSPLSLSMALSMVATGGEGDTRAEILNALGFGNADIEAVNRLNSRLITELPGVDRATKLSIANSIWFDKTLNVKPSFLEANATVYNAEMFNTDLGSSAAKDAINSWVSDKTNGLIPTLLNEAPKEGTSMALINALYFKGSWAEPFNKKLTNRETFHSADGSARPVDMMHVTNLSCTVAHDDAGATWLHLPYGKSRSFEMVLILPDSENAEALESYMTGLSGTSFAENLTTSWSCNAKISLPKFEIESGHDLMGTLEALGIHAALSQKADFSRISDEALCIGSALQRTLIKVDEEGTEAAAVTNIGMDVTSPGPVEVEEFVFDRPFAFVIRECSSGIVLFTGRVSKL